MEHTKPNFRALREIVGLSQSALADLVGVSTTAVKRWEHPDGPQPPQDAWNELEQWRIAHDEAVRQTVLKVETLMNARSQKPDKITLPYWRSQAEYDEFGRDNGPYGVVNASSRAIAQELEKLGITVEFIGPEDRGPEKDA